MANADSIDISNDKFALQLKKYTVVNGVVTIDIVNLQDVNFTIGSFSNYFSYNEYIVNYKLIFQHDQPHYENNQWKKINLECQIYQHDSPSFYFKLSLFPYPYLFQYNLQITNRQETLSKDYIIEIPSIQPFLSLISYTVGDRGVVEYEDNLIDGFIASINENNMVKFESDQLSQNEILTLNASNVSRPLIDLRLLVDITNRDKAEYDMILRNKTANIQNFSIYQCLKQCFIDHYKEIVLEIEYLDARHDTKPIIDTLCRTMSYYVYEYLYPSDHSYSIQCVHDGNYLFLEQQWKFNISLEYQNLKKGIEPYEGNLWFQECYYCDICCVRLSTFEFAYHCDIEDESHGFCITCIHSLVLQNMEMKQLLGKILRDTVDHNCVGLIANFCVGGNVLTFDSQVA